MIEVAINSRPIEVAARLTLGTTSVLAPHTDYRQFSPEASLTSRENHHHHCDDEDQHMYVFSHLLRL